MDYPELTVSITTQNDCPFITIRGTVTAWHGRALEDIITECAFDNVQAIALDLTELSLVDVEGESALTRALRAAAGETNVKVAASNTDRLLVMLSNLNPKVEVYSSAEDVLRSLQNQQDYMTSRWMAESAEDKELPLAA